VDRALEELIWARARSRCEYCLLPARYTEAPFQIDHIIARKHGGATVEGNLALSCYSCNTYKGPLERPKIRSQASSRRSTSSVVTTGSTRYSPTSR
jgi:5-methylcytosine-specific restriction endonuclease McrA